MNHSVLISGASGYIGRQLTEALRKDRGALKTIIGLDLREAPDEPRADDIEYVSMDIRSPELVSILNRFSVSTVVHLASIVTPGRKSDRAFEYSVDVLGTENLLKACVAAGVEKLIVTSSGAAYGYHPDNPAWLDERDPLRGNQDFAYSDHKRLVEEMLRRYRQEHPELSQLIFRPGTILGATADNQITALFEKWYVLGLRGVDSPFVFIWDQDVVACILKGIHNDVDGIYNLAGDGFLTLPEIAAIMGKPYFAMPVWIVRYVLWLLKRLKLTQYGPEQIDFLRYRPVLSNRRLKEEFGYIPQKATREVFQFYVQRRRSSHH
jgi:UDP-glucose 4-epimerase